MNITILIMYLASLGFIILGAFLLNNKYVKKNNNNEEMANEIRPIKISGLINLVIGIIGVICGTIALLNKDLLKIIIIVFVVLIVLLTSTQYIFNKKNK